MSAKDKWTAGRIAAQKGKDKITCLTAYDYISAFLLDSAGIQIALVGDSLGMTMLGYDSTLPVTMQEMLHHTSAVSRGVKNALVLGDMPFLSYQGDMNQAVINAGRFLKEAGADAVKIEGGTLRAPLVERLVANGIPVMGHIGLTPQSIRAFGGYKVQGRQPPEAEKLLSDAKALEAAGVFSIVLECVPAELSGKITDAVRVPTIGIGAGPQCDGQVLVMHDLLGLFEDFRPKFVKQYAQLAPEIRKAFETYKKEVQEGTFPSDEHSY